MSHDLGSVLCAPLCKEMGDLKILNTEIKAKIHPFFKALKAEGPLAVLSVNVNELAGGTLAAGNSVEGGSKYGGEDHIKTVFCINVKMLCKYSPVLVGVHLNAVVYCKAVGMEPLSNGDLLLGKEGRDDLCRKFTGAHITVSLIVECYGDGIFSALSILGNVNVDPKALEALGCSDLGLCRNRLQKIGIKTGLLA